MLAPITLFIINLIRSIRNTWRRLLRRRVDYVKITLHGGLPEFTAPLPWWRRRLLGSSETLSLNTLRRQLQRIADDPNTQGVLLEINGLAAGSATIQSLREELFAFRAMGKRIVAYVYTLDRAGYYAACAADEIITPPSAMFNLLGLYYEAQYLGDALARYGVRAEIMAVSPYKSAAETFARGDMSPENRQQLERMLDATYREIIRTLVEDRGKSEHEAQRLIDQAPFSAVVAHEVGLIDRLLYEDELAAHLRIGEREPIILPWQKARKALRLQMARQYRKLIGVVAVEGAIVSGNSRNVPIPVPLLGGQQAGSDTVAQALRAAERNRRVGAVVLYINSPGGDAFASDLIWREVLRLRRQKPVVVVMGDVAASGGYYIAAPANAIIARQATVTGSIGVISLRLALHDLLERFDIHTETIRRGEHSGLIASSQPLSESERSAWRGSIFTIYDLFKQRVREGRSIADETLEPIAGGRVWTGEDALRLGLVDELGGLPAGVRKAQELADMPIETHAPLLLMRGERGELPPQPFPVNSLAALLETIEEGLKPRVWAVLPWIGPW